MTGYMLRSFIHPQTVTSTSINWDQCAATTYLVVWRSSNVLVSINKVNLCRARLLLRWVTVSGFSSRCRTFIFVCNQPRRPTQPSIPPGLVN